MSIDPDPITEVPSLPRPVMTLREKLSPSRVTKGAAIGPLLILFGLNAVDELDRSAFGVLVPNIRDHFELDNEGILSVIALVSFVALGGQVFIGYYADRFSRIKIASAGAATWGFFTLLTGIVPTVVLLVVARSFTGIGRAVNDPTHNSLLSDYYPPETRVAVYGFHRAANSVGQFLGPAIAGVVAYYFGWRAPFLIFWIPTAILVFLAVTMLKDPVRGGHERRAMGASEESIGTEEVPPSFAEAWRICNQVQTLRRIWLSLPFLAVSLFGLASLYSIYYEEVFGMNEAQRGFILAGTEPFQVLGIVIGIPIAAKLAARDPALVLKFLAAVGVVVSVGIVAFAGAPNLALAIVANIFVAGVLAVIIPGVYAVLSLAIPPRARAIGFSIGSLYILPGLLIIPIIGGIADDIGIRGALLFLVPIYLIGSMIIASAGSFLSSDINKVRASSVAQADVLAARRRGESKLLLVKELDAGYDGVQVLFGIDFEVDEGEIIALLGTNGAGKSTLLKAISGLLPATAGAVIFDGQDMTYAPPQEVAARGVIQVPGGKGVFPGLTVEENIRIAGWLYQKDQAYLKEATEEVLGFFPILRERWDQTAGNLSGGEQQMLTLSQAFIAKPRLLMIDELSLGLAPVIVEQLLVIVEAIRARGTTIILVEQSVNVALTIAETAFFMEKGEIRFQGPTAELLERPDVLRSVFLEGAGSMDGESNVARAKRGGAVVRRSSAARTGQPILDVRSVGKTFGGIRAVHDVSFSLDEGEILGIIGPNGAGKTTLFDLLSGYLPTDGGVIILDGLDVTTMPPDARARLGMGRSFQDARLFPALSVTDTIALSLERQIEIRDPIAAALNLPVVADSERSIARRVDELVELMGLGAFADKFISELSTGSRRIVDLACVLAHEPDVLLFDEPSSGIAQRETEALGPLLLRIREATGASLIVIEHDMPLITSISDRMLALDLGQTVVEGSPDDVVNDPQVVSSYLGTSEEVIYRSGSEPARSSVPRSSSTGGKRTATSRRRRAPLRAGDDTTNGGQS
ncbi:MAG TPA: MFS transporter [Acidimicrobiales bacterium]|nr:MFS transporter [Acidimicrobiales bacterium]